MPLADGRLTPDLFVRAAARAGLSARLVRRRLETISKLTLPCVLLLKDRGRDGRVLIGADGPAKPSHQCSRLQTSKLEPMRWSPGISIA